MSNGSSEAVRGLVSELAKQDSLILAYVKPGLSSNEVRTIVRDAAPELLPLVDETIAAWWSWHNGIDNSKTRPLPSDRYHYIDNVSPGTLMVQPLDQILRMYLAMLEGFREIAGQFQPSRDTFPINYDNGGCLISLCRESPGDPWSVWALAKEGSDWEPIDAQGGEQAISFVDYIDAISQALAGGRLSTRGGGVFLGGSDQMGGYPWL